MTSKSGIIPVGYSVVVLPDQVSNTTDSGIQLMTDVQHEREQMGQTDGEVVAISPQAFADENLPRCKVGDRIIFARHTGTIRQGNDDLYYRIIRDIDVVAILDKKEK